MRENLKQITRRKLLDAAREAFEENGYAKTSAEEITLRAGASRATFYLHFGGKHDVLAEIVAEAHFTPVLELVESLGSMGVPTVEEIRAWLDSFDAIYERTRGIMRAWVQAGGREGAPLRALADEMREKFLDAMAAKVSAVLGRAGYEVAPEDARMRALMMFIEVERLCFYLHIRGLDFDVKASLDLVARQWSSILAHR
ncbi:TetR/AcrR family transcriptional regulator [Streptomyces chartreusis]|uniref:TetR/AcrR family transcriptional regulator n=1 Tax=Streptomyces chartreusis TaxID=1969 RepID=UPI00362AE372